MFYSCRKKHRNIVGNKTVGFIVVKLRKLFNPRRWGRGGKVELTSREEVKANIFNGRAKYIYSTTGDKTLDIFFY